MNFSDRLLFPNHKAIYALLENSGIELNITKRWETGTAHHPKAEALANMIGDLDFIFLKDSLYLKFGGDGDNGESLTYVLDIFFEALDVGIDLTGGQFPPERTNSL